MVSTRSSPWSAAVAPVAPAGDRAALRVPLEPDLARLARQHVVVLQLEAGRARPCRRRPYRARRGPGRRTGSTRFGSWSQGDPVELEGRDLLGRPRRSSWRPRYTKRPSPGQGLGQSSSASMPEHRGQRPGRAAGPSTSWGSARRWPTGRLRASSTPLRSRIDPRSAAATSTRVRCVLAEAPPGVGADHLERGDPEGDDAEERARRRRQDGDAPTVLATGVRRPGGSLSARWTAGSGPARSPSTVAVGAPAARPVGPGAAPGGAVLIGVGGPRSVVRAARSASRASRRDHAQLLGLLDDVARRLQLAPPHVEALRLGLALATSALEAVEVRSGPAPARYGATATPNRTTKKAPRRQLRAACGRSRRRRRRPLAAGPRRSGPAGGRRRRGAGSGWCPAGRERRCPDWCG